MKLQLFDGGVATRLAPQLLNNNQGVVYENIDNTQGILAPIKDKLVTAIAAQLYNKYFVAEDEWLNSATTTDFLEFQKKMYLTDRITRPQKYSSGVYNFLGIEAPTAKCDTAILNQAPPLVDITVVNDISSGDFPTSDIDYALFNVNADGVYSIPFRFVVDASISTFTRATGEVLEGFENFSQRLGNTITTVDQLPNRSIRLQRIEGDMGASAKLYRYYDGVWRFVNSFTLPADVFLDSVYDISAAAELDTDLITSFNSTYQYVYTYYNVTDGTESAPSSVSDELKVQSGKIDVSGMINSTDPQVTNKRLYRVGGALAQFTLVTTLDNVVTTYTDELLDIEVDGRLLDSDNYYEAPTGLQFLTEAYAMLFGAIGTSLRFTPIGVPNAWPLEFELQFNAEITGIGPVANGLLVFTRFKTYIVTGTGPTSLAQQPLRGDQGCIAFESIQEIMEGMLIWASDDGLCSSSGNNVQSLTKNALGDIVLDPVSSAAHNESYYCHNADGSTLVWDYRFQPILKWLDLGVETLAVANTTIYGYTGGFLHALYKDAANLTQKYKSPRFVEGSFSEAKTYKKVYIRSEGDIMIDMLIDDISVATFNLTTKDTHQLQVPQQLQRGYSFQFIIEGTGVVQEVEYRVSLRKND